MSADLLPAFAELRDQLDTGDIVLFGGDSRFCKAIKRFSRSHWSHVALVARRPGHPPLLWEATLGTDLADLVTHEVKPGVNLYDLETWIRHYGGETAIRRLHVARTDEMLQALLAFYEEARGRPYEKNRLEMLRSVYDGPLGKNREENAGSFFCSELVAEAYMRLGLLPDLPHANEYTPRDFAGERGGSLALRLDATLGELVWVCEGGAMTMGSTMTNEALARRWFTEVWNQRRADTVRELLTEDSVCQSEGGPLRGADAFLEGAHKPFLAAFPDLKLQIDVTVSQGDEVVVRWTATATHTGDGLGIPPTGRRVTFRGMTWIRYKDGKMIEGWDCWNQCGLMQALGDGPAPPSMVVA